MDEITIKLKNIIMNNRIAFENERNLKALFKDYFPENKRIQNILLAVVSEGILQELKVKTNLKKADIIQYVRRIEDNYGLTQDAAYMAVTIWIEALEIQAEDISERIKQQAKKDTDGLLKLKKDTLGFIQLKKQNNFIFVNLYSSVCLEYAKRWMEKNSPGKKVNFSVVNALGDLCAALNGNEDGDVCLIRMVNKCFNEEMWKVIEDCIVEQKVIFQIGKGVAAHSIQLEIPRIYLMLCVERLEDIPEKTGELFTIISKDDLEI